MAIYLSTMTYRRFTITYMDRGYDPRLLGSYESRSNTTNFQNHICQAVPRRRMYGHFVQD
jgi:hypothetical protein